VAKFAALAQASICEPVHAFGPLRWAHAFERTVNEEIARADVVQLKDSGKIACENNIAR
jgi:hypothetical protein